MSLRYSMSGEINRVLFFSKLNDVNIFMEDKDKEFEYEIIFNRMFNNGLKITTLFGVGGKSQLKEAYKKLLKTKGINIFITDMDFDNI